MSDQQTFVRQHCSHCHEPVTLTGTPIPFTPCPSCSHDASVSRLACRCRRCTTPPVPPTQAEIALALAWLEERRRRKLS